MIDVVMPQMGESIVEGTLTKWLKKAGDHVERDEPLFEISTDKVDTEIPSPAAGTLAEILVEEGKTVGINTVVGRISDGAGQAAAPAAAQPAAVPPSSACAQRATPARSNCRNPTPPPPPAPAAPVVDESAGPLSPLVRKMARENNIDLSRIRGTGAGAASPNTDLEAIWRRQQRLLQRPRLRPLQPTASSAAPASSTTTHGARARQAPVEVPAPPPAREPTSCARPDDGVRRPRTKWNR